MESEGRGRADGLVGWLHTFRLSVCSSVWCLAGSEGEIEAEWILLGVWAQRESAGHKLLATLGFTGAMAAELEKEVREDRERDATALRVEEEGSAACVALASAHIMQKFSLLLCLSCLNQMNAVKV